MGISQSGDRTPAVLGPLQGLGTVIEVEVGYQSSCARTMDGAVRCWGSDNQQALGNGDEPSIAFAQDSLAVDGLPPVDELALGAQHGCGTAAGELYCWGRSSEGQIGTQSIGSDKGTAEQVFADGAPFPEVDRFALSGQATCVVFVDGEVHCWGRGSYGELANGDDAPIVDLAGSQGPIADLDNVVAIDGGAYHFCAVHGDGKVSCWGSNADGQLGDPNSFGEYIGDDPGETVVTHELDVDVVGVGAGEKHTCVLTRDGNVRCWGRGDDGRLGTGNTTSVIDATLAVDIKL